jgi:hypothetical protein
MIIFVFQFRYSKDNMTSSPARSAELFSEACIVNQVGLDSLVCPDQETGIAFYANRPKKTTSPSATAHIERIEHWDRLIPGISPSHLPSFVWEQLASVTKLLCDFMNLLNALLDLSSRSQHIALRVLEETKGEIFEILLLTVRGVASAMPAFIEQLYSLKEEVGQKIGLLSSIGAYRDQIPSLKIEADDSNEYGVSAQLYLAFSHCNESLTRCVKLLSTSIEAYEEQSEELLFLPEIIQTIRQAEADAMHTPDSEALGYDMTDAAIVIQTYLRAFTDRHSFSNSCKTSTRKPGKPSKKKQYIDCELRFGRIPHSVHGISSKSGPL